MAIIAQLGVLLLSATILLTGNALQTSLLPLRAEAEAFPALAIGIMGSSYFIGFVAGCLTTAMLVRRVGHSGCSPRWPPPHPSSRSATY